MRGMDVEYLSRFHHNGLLFVREIILEENVCV